MPTTTPHQKVSKTQIFGGNNIEIKMIGDYFDYSSDKLSGTKK